MNKKLRILITDVLNTCENWSIIDLKLKDSLKPKNDKPLFVSKLYKIHGIAQGFNRENQEYSLINKA